MSFQSLAFLAFLAVTVPACLLCARRSRRAGMTALGIASLVFYMAGGGRDAFAVLCAGTLVSIWAVQRLWREEAGRAMCALAREAHSVTRMFCGLPLRLK